MHAFSQGNKANLRMLLDFRRDAANRTGFSPLCRMLEAVIEKAIETDSVEMARIVMEYHLKYMPDADKAGPNKMALNDWLKLAAKSNSLNVAEMPFKLHPTIPARVMLITFEAACKNKSAEMVSILLQGEENILGKMGPNKAWAQTCPLNTAIEVGSLDIVKVVLDAGALPNGIYQKVKRPNTPNREPNWRPWMTPLFTAIRADALDVIKLLLQRGANPDKRSEYTLEIKTLPPLTYALETDKAEAYELLRQAKMKGGGRPIPTFEEAKADMIAEARSRQLRQRNLLE